jgi:hypothetical protein
VIYSYQSIIGYSKESMKGKTRMLHRIYHLLRLNSLKRRLRFWFIFLLLLFIILGYVPFILYAKEYREIEAQNNIQQTINLQQLVIDKWFEDKVSTILTISQMSDVRAIDKKKIKKALETVAEHQPEFSRIVFVNKQGVTEIDSSGSPSIDISDRIYFQEARKGNSYVTDVLIERQSNQDVIIFSSPILDDEQKFQGLILGSVRLDTINQVMKKFRFSETGQTYLVNREGMLLTQLRFPSVVEEKGTNAGNGTKINTEIFGQAMQGKKVTQSYQDYRGSTVFGDYRWVNGGQWLIIG